MPGSADVLHGGHHHGIAQSEGSTEGGFRQQPQRRDHALDRLQLQLDYKQVKDEVKS